MHTPRVRRPALCLALTLVACGSASRSGGLPPAVSGPDGTPAKSVDFELADARGGGALRLSDFRGRPTIIHFFATWCAPCEAEFQNLNQLAELHREKGDLAILGVSVDLDGKKLLPVFLEVRALAYPVALADEAMLHGQTPFGPLAAIPATYLVDAEGRHVDTFHGVVPYAHLKARLERLLASP